MPDSVAHQSSFSMRSISKSRGVSRASSVSGMSGMGSMGGIAILPPSVCGGAGGYGTRISWAIDPYFNSSFAKGSVIFNEKMTMQNLNDRLASYLAQVRSLEAANSKLELQIREYEKKSPSASRDYSAYFATINNLRAQISTRFMENQKIILHLENAQLAADDFKSKAEIEMSFRCMLEADLVSFRGVLTNLTLAATYLEGQVESLKEELVFMQKNHQEDMNQSRAQCDGSVNVAMDSSESVDLQAILEEMRQQYEALMAMNKNEMEKWFQAKITSLQSEITARTTEVQTSSSELMEQKRMSQSLEISLQSAYAEIAMLQESLEETKSRDRLQLSQLQMTITSLESKLQQLKVSMEELQTDYSLLLNIKMRLEMEIAEYRRLLEGEYHNKNVLVIRGVEETVAEETVVAEEHKPLIEKRVKIIVEKIVDGKVVDTSVDTKVETIQ